MDKIWLKSYQEGVPANISLSATDNLVDLLLASCEEFKSRQAFFNFGVSLSYQQLAEYSRYFAAAIQQLGLVKGERIAIMLPNVLQYPVGLLGALRAGLVIVNVNPLYTKDELTAKLKDADVHAILVLDWFVDTVRAAAVETNLRHIIVTELSDLFPYVKAQLTRLVVKYIKGKRSRIRKNEKRFRKLLSEGEKRPLKTVHLQSEDVAFLQYTGGTTGGLKAAILTHGNVTANVQQLIAWINPSLTRGQEIIVTPLPLYHIFSLTVNCFTFLNYGATNYLISDPRDIKAMIKLLRSIPFSLMTGVNTLFHALLTHADFAKLNFRHLKIALGGGMSVHENVAQKWQSVTGVPLLEGYGLTESSPVVAISPLCQQHYTGSIGLPIPSTDIAIRDEDGQQVESGEIGELYVRGPQVMQGYWQQQEETRSVLSDEGWLATGDMARIDEHGFVYIVDRCKDMINVSGFKVYPSEVEHVLEQHPAVSEVAVIGVASEHSGEKVKAIIVKQGALTANEVIAYCREHLTSYKCPKQIEFVNELPKTPVGKIDKRALRI